MELFKETKIDFLKYRWIFMGISAVIIVAGLLMIFKNGLNYGVDFSGGTAIHVKFRTQVPLDQVRNALKGSGFADSGVQGFSDPTQMLIRIPQALSNAEEIEAMSAKISETLMTQILKKSSEPGKEDINAASISEIRGYLQARDPWGVKNPDAYNAEVEKIANMEKENGGLLPAFDKMTGVDARVVNSLKEKFYESDVVVLSNEYVGPQVGSELRAQAQLAIMWSLIGLMVYVWFRFQLVWGVSAVICLAHDVLITLSLFAFTGREISLTVVAAFLTIVGFSLNDTIVIYDRVRDNLKTMRTQPLANVINLTLNQMLNRTILTNGTVTIVTIVLFLFGGEVINDFSFAMLVGCISGTYSTIYIASALIILYDEHFGKEKERYGVCQSEGKPEGILMARVLDGKALAEQIRSEVAAQAEDFSRQSGRRPKLAAVLVGDDPASHVYVRNKIRSCEQAGIESESHHLSAVATEPELLHLLRALNDSDTVDGILLQLPLPKQIDKTRALDTILPAKDVDGLHPCNVGLLVQGRAQLIACTPLGVIEALRRYNVPMSGARAVVVGRSDLVGKPLSTLLLHENATVTVCHSKTRDLWRIVADADIVVAAMGKPAFLQPEFIREGAVVLDVGTTVLKDEKDVIALFGASSKKLEDLRSGKTVLVGDVHPAAYEKTSLYTPVPGGVGPLTIAMLLRNTVTAARIRHFS